MVGANTEGVINFICRSEGRGINAVHKKADGMLNKSAASTIDAIVSGC